MTHRRELAISFFICLILAIFTILVRKGTFAQLDFDITVKMQDHLLRRYDTPFSLFSLLGSAEIITFFLIATVAHYGKKLIPIFIGYIGGTIIELLGKTVVFHPGPPSMFFHYDLGPIFPSSYIFTSFSYPSGHSFRTVFIAYVWILLAFRVTKSKLIRGLIIAAAIVTCGLMLVSRVALGEHWTTDVIAGSLLGLGLAIGSCAFRNFSSYPRRKSFLSNFSS